MVKHNNRHVTPPHKEISTLARGLFLLSVFCIMFTLSGVTVKASGLTSWEYHVQHWLSTTGQDATLSSDVQSFISQHNSYASGAKANCNCCHALSVTEDSYTAPTCTSGGRMTFSCKNDNCFQYTHTGIRQFGQATCSPVGHSYTTATTISAGDCTHGGSVELKCCYCGASGGTRSVPAMGHDMSQQTLSTIAGFTYVESSGVYTVDEVDAIYNGHKSIDCCRDGVHDHDEYLVTVYVRYQNEDGTYGSPTQQSSTYYNPGSVVTYSREADDDFQSASLYYVTESKPGTIYVNINRKGYIVKYNPNRGTGSIPDDYFLYGMWYNLSAGTEFSQNHSVLLGWTEDSTAVRRLDAEYQYSLGESVTNIAHSGGTVQLYAVWRPWWYNVTYHSNIPGRSDVATNLLNVKYEYDMDYVPMSWTKANDVSGFIWTGHYIDRWSTQSTLAGVGYSTNNPYSAGGADKFRNLASDTRNANLYAIWKGNPYKIVLHDNYHGCSCTEVYSTRVDEEFILPKYANKHVKYATLLGYDYDPSHIGSPTFKVGDSVVNLTMTANDVVDLYAIWDDIPVINSPAQLKIDRKAAAAAGITFTESGAVKQSDLALLLMNYATAYDSEWTARYYTDYIPAGRNKGYTFEVANIDPVNMKNNLSNTYNYMITYICTDDAGNSVTSTTELLFGDSDNKDDWISIMVDTN